MAMQDTENIVEVLGVLSWNDSRTRAAVLMKVLSGYAPDKDDVIKSSVSSSRWRVASYGFVKPRRDGEWLVEIEPLEGPAELIQGEKFVTES